MLPAGSRFFACTPEPDGQSREALDLLSARHRHYHYRKIRVVDVPGRVKEYVDIPDIECLPPQLNQVYMNLLVNAAHAIGEKGTITIRTGALNDTVWVEVSDTSKGIEPEHLNRIFDPFFTTNRVASGAGLGLSVSYSIIQKHYDSINVASEVGKGKTFRISLPVKQPEAKQE